MLPYTSFIGRTGESAEIQRMLTQPDCRLLTIVGPGGIGKTRLALHVGDTLAEHFARGSTVVYLQPVSAKEYVMPAIADALGFALTGQEEPLVQLGRYLRDKELLLVLDNFEHLLDAADDLGELLGLAPGVTYLVTSREALNLQEEWLYPIAGLQFPGETAAQAAEMHFDAVELFSARAARVRPDFSLDQELGAVVRICRLVSGLPLASELAAAWRKSLDCAAIADEIQADLDFLTTRLRDIPERHRSMPAVFEQTWRRLTPRDRRPLPGFLFSVAVFGARPPRRWPARPLSPHRAGRQFTAVGRRRWSLSDS